MPGPDKNAMLQRIAGKAPGYSSDDVVGAPTAEPDGDEAPLSCGEQLMQAINSGDASLVDEALKEAVRKYK